MFAPGQARIPRSIIRSIALRPYHRATSPSAQSAVSTLQSSRLPNAVRPVPSSRSRQQSHRLRSTFYNPDEDQDEAGHSKTVLVLGSSGFLGRAVAHRLSTSCRVIGADVIVPDDLDDTSNPTHGLNHGFVQVTPDADLTEMTGSLVRGLAQILDQKLDVIVCASGGFQMDPPMPIAGTGNKNSNDDESVAFLESVQQHAQTIDRMIRINLYPTIAANFVAHRYMTDDDGLFVVLGATTALNATPGMMGYGISKVAAHHVAYTVGETTLKSITTKGKRRATQKYRKYAPYLDKMTVVGVLPTTLDTPANREAMPDGKFDSWTAPEDIATEIETWIETPSLRPHSGALVKVVKDRDGSAFRLVR